MIKVLIVEDSPVSAALMSHVISSDPSLKVAGIAPNGREALALLQSCDPDVITMDVNMPVMNGFAATKKIMEISPRPIIIVSSLYSKDTEMGFKTLQAGALAITEKPAAPGTPHYYRIVESLIETIKMTAGLKLVRRWSSAEIAPPASSALNTRAAVRLIAIGASTGGPPVLRSILARLPKELSIPIMIVQHISRGFTQGLAEWLAQAAGFPVHVAAHGDHLLPGHAYLAPDDRHMGLSNGSKVLLSEAPPERNIRPSVSFLFRSLAQVAPRDNVAVLLTGMGVDGALELKKLRELGAVTIVQDQASSIVYGMPGEAARLGAAMYILPPAAIADELAGMAEQAMKSRERQGGWY